MNCLFIEASAKTAVGVRDAFQEVVTKILDTPELWQPVTANKSGAVKVGQQNSNNQTMPGSVNLNDDAEGEEAGGCMC